MGKQGRAVGGSLLGGLSGAVLGLFLGGFLGPIVGGVEQHSAESILYVFDSCMAFLFTLVGAAVGAAVGAVGGAAIGAVIATTGQEPPNVQAAEPTEAIPSKPERLQSADAAGNAHCYLCGRLLSAEETKERVCQACRA